MSKRRLVNTKFWSDGFVVNLNPFQRYLFLYLLTNEHTEICGVYELPLTVMERETGIPIEDTNHYKGLRTILKALEDKIFYHDGWIYIKNFTKNQSSNKNMEIGAQRSLDALPKQVKDNYQKILDGVSLVKPSKRCGKPEPEPELELINKSINKNATEVALEEIPDLLKDNKKHVVIIGIYAKAKNVIFNSKEHQAEFIKRNCQAAKVLVPYDPNKIIQTMLYLSSNANYKWTLETVSKYIDEDLEKLNKSFLATNIEL